MFSLYINCSLIGHFFTLPGAQIMAGYCGSEWFQAPNGDWRTQDTRCRIVAR